MCPSGHDAARGPRYAQGSTKDLTITLWLADRDFTVSMSMRRFCKMLPVHPNVTPLGVLVPLVSGTY